MTFVPENRPLSDEDFVDWALDQIDEIAGVLRSYNPEYIIYQPLNEALTRFEEGLVYYVNGTDLDPGHGKGLYHYNGTKNKRLADQVHYLTLDTVYNTASIGTGVSMGTVPADSIILPHHVEITTAYNAGTTNVLEVGTAGTANKYVAAGDVDETTIAFTANITTGCITETSATEIFIKFTETGTAATAGASTVIIPYLTK